MQQQLAESEKNDNKCPIEGFSGCVLPFYEWKLQVLFSDQLKHTPHTTTTGCSGLHWPSKLKPVE